MITAQELNYFPAKGGILEYLSPHMILSKHNIDYNKHCQFTFGTYIQAIQENNPKNTQAPRTIDAIYLRPLKNIQGGHEVMNLATGAVVTHETRYGNNPQQNWSSRQLREWLKDKDLIY